jgi:hypothetical protein
VGAALEGPKSFRVWYFVPTKPIANNSSSSSSSSSAPYPKFKLRKSLPFACDSGSEATALVQCVRQAAAWQGRQAAPRVLAVINPMSGQGRCAWLDAMSVASHVPASLPWMPEHCGP